MSNRRSSQLPVMLLAALLLLLPVRSATAHDLDHRHALEMSRQGRIVPAQQLLAQALVHYPQARLLGMKLTHKKNGYIYKMQLLTRDGEVHKLYFDAESGELLRNKEKS